MEGGYKINLIKQSQKELITGLHQEIESRIEGVNDTLTTSFKVQEEKLLGRYKSELEQAKKTLRKLEESSNEAELKKRTDEKQLQLKAEIEKVQQQTMHHNNKYNEFKQYQEQTNSLRDDVQSELKFFDSQLIQAQKVNQKLTHERDLLFEQILQYDQNFKLDEDSNIWDTFNKANDTRRILSNSIQSQILNQSKIDYISPYSYRLLNEQNTSRNLSSQKTIEKNENCKKQLEKLESEANMTSSDLESCFIDTVQQFNDLKNKKSQLPKINSSKHQRDDIYVEEEFNDHEKKQLMEFFLSKTETKKIIYQILSENRDINLNDLKI